MAKVNISLPDGLLEEIDSRAAERGTTRSGFIQEASARYAIQLDEEHAQEKRRADVGDFLDVARRIGRDIPSDLDTTALTRQDRGSSWDWHDD